MKGSWAVQSWRRVLYTRPVLTLLRSWLLRGLTLVWLVLVVIAIGWPTLPNVVAPAVVLALVAIGAWRGRD